MKRRQTRVVGNTCVYYVMYVSVENALLGHKEPETDGDITDQTERARLSRTGLSSLLSRNQNPAAHTRSVELSDPLALTVKHQPSKIVPRVLNGRQFSFQAPPLWTSLDSGDGHDLK